MLQSAVTLPLLSAAAASCLPPKMPALVATGVREDEIHFKANWPTPKLGDLHKRYVGALQPIDSCEVLVAVSHSSVNPADRYVSQPTPQVMGSDIAGTVVKTQDSCKRLKVGDKVWADIGAVTFTFPHIKAKENGAYAPVAVAWESQ